VQLELVRGQQSILLQGCSYHLRYIIQPLQLLPVCRVFFHALANVVPRYSTQQGAYSQGYSIIAGGKVSDKEPEDPDEDGPESTSVGALFRRNSGRFLVVVALAFAA